LSLLGRYNHPSKLITGADEWLQAKLSLTTDPHLSQRFELDFSGSDKALLAAYLLAAMLGI
jgi:hypothetical protein